MAGLYIGVGASVGYDEYESKVNVREKCVVVDDTMVGRLGLNRNATLSVPSYNQDNEETTLEFKNIDLEATADVLADIFEPILEPQLKSLFSGMTQDDLNDCKKALLSLKQEIDNPINVKNNEADELVNKLWNSETGRWEKDDVYIRNELVVGNPYLPIKVYRSNGNPISTIPFGKEDACLVYQGKNDHNKCRQLYSEEPITDGEEISAEEILFRRRKGMENISEAQHAHIGLTKKIASAGAFVDYYEYDDVNQSPSFIAFNSNKQKYDGCYPINVYSPTIWSPINPDTKRPLIDPNLINQVLFPGSLVDEKKSSYMMQKSLSRSGKNKGIELKMSYFHDFGNHIMAGVDLTGAVLTKNKQSINAAQYSNLTLWGTESGIIAHAEYKDGQYVTKATPNAQIAKNEKLVLSPTLPDADQVKMTYSTDPLEGSYIDATKGNQEVHFEKGVFNPKLALVVGGVYNGWFAGIRAGMSYNTGKVSTSDNNASKSVSIASPLVGLHVMKKISPTTNVYMTADWNVGETSRPVLVNGIKSFKQSSYSISAGVSWKCSKFLK